MPRDRLRINALRDVARNAVVRVKELSDSELTQLIEDTKGPAKRGNAYAAIWLRTAAAEEAYRLQFILLVA